MLLQNALYKFYSADDITFIIPMAVREQLETHPLVAYLVNLVPVRHQVDASKSIMAQSREWAKIVQDALAYNLPHGILLKEVPALRPHLDVGFQYVPTSDVFQSEVFGGLEALPLKEATLLSHSKCHLNINISPKRLLIDYYKELLDGERMQKFSLLLVDILKEAVGFK